MWGKLAKNLEYCAVNVLIKPVIGQDPRAGGPLGRTRLTPPGI